MTLLKMTYMTIPLTSTCYICYSQGFLVAPINNEWRLEIKISCNINTQHRTMVSLYIYIYMIVTFSWQIFIHLWRTQSNKNATYGIINHAWGKWDSSGNWCDAMKNGSLIDEVDSYCQMSVVVENEMNALRNSNICFVWYIEYTRGEVRWGKVGGSNASGHLNN